MSTRRLVRSVPAGLALIVALVTLRPAPVLAQADNPNAPTIEQPADQSYAEGDTITPFTISATDPNGSALTYYVDFLPNGIGFDPDTHLVSGTLSWNSAGGYPTVRITVLNAEGLYARAYFRLGGELQKRAVACDRVPTFARDTNGAYLVSTPRGVPIDTLTLNGTNPQPCTGVRFTLNNGQTLPPGLTLTPPSDYGANAGCASGFVWHATITGTPTVQGTTTFTVNANDPTLPLATFIWTVTNTRPSSVPSATSQSRPGHHFR